MADRPPGGTGTGPLGGGPAKGGAAIDQPRAPFALGVSRGAAAKMETHLLEPSAGDDSSSVLQESVNVLGIPADPSKVEGGESATLNETTIDRDAEADEAPDDQEGSRSEQPARGETTNAELNGDDRSPSNAAEGRASEKSCLAELNGEESSLSVSQSHSKMPSPPVLPRRSSRPRTAAKGKDGVPLESPKVNSKREDPQRHRSEQPTREETTVAELDGDARSLWSAAEGQASGESCLAELNGEERSLTTAFGTSSGDLAAAATVAAATDILTPSSSDKRDNETALAVNLPRCTETYKEADNLPQPVVVTPKKNLPERREESSGGGLGISASQEPIVPSALSGANEHVPPPLPPLARQQDAAAKDAAPPTGNDEGVPGNAAFANAHAVADTTTAVPLLPPEPAAVSGASSSSPSSTSVASTTSDGSPCETSTDEDTSSVNLGARGNATVGTANGKTVDLASVSTIDAHVKEAASQVMSSEELPGPGWRKAAFRSGGKLRPLWVSPDEGIRFDTRRAAFQFDRLRQMHPGEAGALEAYKEMKQRLGEKTRIRTTAMTVDGSRHDHATTNSEETDECYVCGDGGDLSPYPQGNGCGMECKAPLLKKRYRCGECDECTRPDCGRCTFCLNKVKWGGDGTYGKPCKLRQCKNMRYALPEKMPMVNCAVGRTGKRKQRMQNKDQQHVAPNKKPRTDAARSARQKAAFERSSPLRQPPGPGWTHKKVAEGNGNVYYWISPSRKIVFIRRLQACEFEKLRRQKCGDEHRAWEAYRGMKRGRGTDTWVVSPSQYDTDLTKARSAKASTCKSAGVNAGGSRRKMTASSITIGAQGAQHCPRNAPPGDGWQCMPISDGQNRTYWLSPARKIQFRLHTHACQFEGLIQEHGDEFKAWAAYRELKRRADTYVVSPGQYDTDSTKAGSTKRTSEQIVCRNAAPAEKRHKASSKAPSIAKGKRAVTEKRTVRRSTASKERKPAKSNTAITPFKSCPPPTPADGLNCSEYKLVCLKSTSKVTFFHQRFPGRILRVERSLSDDTPPDKTIVHNGVKYTLASAKVLGDKPGAQKHFGHEKKIELIYVQRQGLQKELAKVCNFSLMAPEKVVARLAHLQSEAQKICYVDVSKIKTVREEGHEGCGYFPEGFFDTERGMKNCDSIQVRLVGPKLGLAKGMLLKKRGISHIQLPKSMMKAPPSKSCNENWVAVVVKNVFPSKENENFGRYLDPHKSATKSWKEKTRKPLSPMYQRMLIGYGVTVKTVEQYTKRSKECAKLRHAHLIGCIDPTGNLPQNKVFISGYCSGSSRVERELFGKIHRTIFLTRSPSVAPEDAKLVSVVGSKPEGMSADDWDQLCSYEFGTIIFPKPKTGFAPLPCIIADGDLDGDDFFVLWDDKILRHLLRSGSELTTKSRELLHRLELPDRVKPSVNKGTKLSSGSDVKWLSKAQDLMLDFPTQRAASEIVGKLYTLCTKASKRANGKFDIYDEDAVAYARAYKDALDIQKHGGKIVLPEHLHEELPEPLRVLLTSE